jgi:hypothetical protein
MAVLSNLGLNPAHNTVKIATLSATSMICLTKNDFGIIHILNNALFAHIDVTPFGPMRYVHENRPSGAVG